MPVIQHSLNIENVCIVECKVRRREAFFLSVNADNKGNSEALGSVLEISAENENTQKCPAQAGEQQGQYSLQSS